MKQTQTKIWVYADWDFLEEAQLMGWLTSQRVRGKEIFSFEYNIAIVGIYEFICSIISLGSKIKFYSRQQYYIIL
jgi:hypothetical protein